MRICDLNQLHLQDFDVSTRKRRVDESEIDDFVFDRRLPGLKKMKRGPDQDQMMLPQEYSGLDFLASE